LQRGDVGLGGRVRPHATVHGRSDDHRTARGQRRQREKVVAQTIGQFGDGIGRGRSDEEQVGALAQSHVLYVVVERPHVVVDRPPGDGAKGQGGDEAGGRFGEDDVDQGPGLGQPGGQIDGFVTGDGAGDAEEYVFALQDGDGVHEG